MNGDVDYILGLSDKELSIRSLQSIIGREYDLLDMNSAWGKMKAYCSHIKITHVTHHGIIGADWSIDLPLTAVMIYCERSLNGAVKKKLTWSALESIQRYIKCHQSADIVEGMEYHAYKKALESIS